MVESGSDEPFDMSRSWKLLALEIVFMSGDPRLGVAVMAGELIMLTVGVTWATPP